MANLVLIGIVLLVGVAALYLKYKDKKVVTKAQDFDVKKFEIPSIEQWVKDAINEITNSSLYDLGLNEEEFRRRASKRSKLKHALQESVHGDVLQKNYVKSYLYDLLLQDYGFTDETINLTIPFDEPSRLTSQDKFEILLFKLKKNHNYNALGYLIEKYNLASLKYFIEEGETASYIITASEIDKAFQKEVKNLAFEDKLWIIVQRIFQQYKGFGVIDEIRDMNIDGVSGGVNGIPSSAVLFGEDGDLYTEPMNGFTIPYDYDSIWIFYKGKSIHLSFLTFGSEMELKRVCHNIYKYNMPGPLTETNGYRVNEMKDGSRVVVVRPNFAESYAFFVRKFDIPSANLDTLFPADKVKNSEMVKLALIFLMKGRRVTAVTGLQGSGKTTLMMAMVKHVAATLNIRVQEMAFELHLRKLFPFRNILSFRETETVTGQQGLDLQKKTDGSVTILGEMAEFKTASQVVQSAEVNSDFTMFSAHPITPQALINYMSNALVKVDGFSNEKAEEQVVNVLDFNVHLKKRQNGFRHLERITEIIPHTDKLPYEEDNLENAGIKDVLKSLTKTFREYAGRSTDRKRYEFQDIIRYENGRYVWVHPISERNAYEMKENMSDNECAAFELFVSICESLQGQDWDEIVSKLEQSPTLLMRKTPGSDGL